MMKYGVNVPKSTSNSLGNRIIHSSKEAEYDYHFVLIIGSCRIWRLIGSLWTASVIGSDGGKAISGVWGPLCIVATELRCAHNETIHPIETLFFPAMFLRGAVLSGSRPRSAYSVYGVQAWWQGKVLAPTTSLACLWVSFLRFECVWIKLIHN